MSQGTEASIFGLLCVNCFTFIDVIVDRTEHKESHGSRSDCCASGKGKAKPQASRLEEPSTGKRRWYYDYVRENGTHLIVTKPRAPTCTGKWVHASTCWQRMSHTSLHSSVDTIDNVYLYRVQ